MVSYNSAAFRSVVLDELMGKGVVLHWWSIVHPAYTDRITGKERKEHVHLELLCDEGFDSDDICKAFNEFDPTHPDKPLGCQHDDKERHIPLSLQLEHALLYDLHDKRYILLNPKIGEKPYYDLDYNTILTDSQQWLDMISLDSSKDFWTKLVQKPSKEEIFTAIYEQKPIVEGDVPLTVSLARKRHWVDCFSFSQLAKTITAMRGLDIDDLR